MTAFPLSLMACERPSDLATGVVFCARPGIPSIVVEIRDAEGRPSAIGATAEINNAKGARGSAEGFEDSLKVAVFAGNAGGTFRVLVRKPWHHDVQLTGVNAPAGPCGVSGPTPVAVRLDLLPNAPPVRQVVAAPHGYGFGWGNLTAQMRAYVVADEGVSHEVKWRSTDATVATITLEGLLRSGCRKSPGETWVIVESGVDPSKRDSVRVSVSADNDQARCPSS